MLLLSIVIPCYNEEEGIAVSLDMLTRKLEEFGIKDYEIICVNDGSKDQTLSILQNYAQKDHRIKIVSLAANRGQQTAFYAGMCYSSGEAVILMDADLQDPPDCIPEMLRLWKEGYQVVFGKRIIRQGEGIFKRLTAFLFYRLLNHLSYTVIPQDVGEFRLMDRVVVDVVINMEEHNRFNRAMVSWLGFSQIELPFERPERTIGTTKFGMKDMFQLAKDGLFSFSYFPILFLQSLGLIAITISIILAIYTLYSLFLTNNFIPGWGSLMMTFLFFSGAILLGLGIIGEYVARIHTEVIKRPLFIAAETMNLKNKELPKHLSYFHSRFNKNLK